MLYPIAIELGDEQHAYDVIVPDVPGCFSAGDTLEEAFKNAKEAISFHIEGMLEDGGDILLPTSMENHRSNPDYDGFMWAVVDVDLTYLMGKSEKLNITLPSLLIKRIDEFVARHPDYKNRSNFLAKVATDRLLSA